MNISVYVDQYHSDSMVVIHLCKHMLSYCPTTASFGKGGLLSRDAATCSQAIKIRHSVAGRASHRRNECLWDKRSVISSFASICSFSACPDPALVSHLRN